MAQENTEKKNQSTPDVDVENTEATTEKAPSATRSSNRGKPNRSDEELLREAEQKAEAIRVRIAKKQNVRLEKAISALAGKKISLKDMGTPDFDAVLTQLEEITAGR